MICPLVLPRKVLVLVNFVLGNAWPLVPLPLKGNVTCIPGVMAKLWFATIERLFVVPPSAVLTVSVHPLISTSPVPGLNSST